MNAIKRKCQRRPYGPLAGLALALAIAGGATPSIAQEEEDEGSYFELSPFTVDASSSSGYVARETLARSRLKTNLSEVGSSLSVITEDFMDDIEATDAKQLLVYTLGTEVAGGSGNFSGTGGAGPGDIANVAGSRFKPQNATRVRGLASADLTRAFFLTDIPFDTYNTDRIEIQRGPNSVLFGLGSPGGIINNSLSRPLFAKTGEIKTRFDDEGSYRVTLDANAEIIDDVLGFRFAALDEKTQFRQNPAKEDDTRVYAAMEFRRPEPGSGAIIGRTTIRASLEVGETDAIPEIPVGPVDSFSPWFAAGQPEFDVLALSRQGIGPGDLPWANSPGIFRRLFNAWEADGSPALDGGVGLVARVPAGVIDDPTLKANLDFVGTTSDTEFRGLTNVGWPLQGFVDTRFFDFEESLVSGRTDFRKQDFEAYQITLEQQLLDGKAGFELTYDKQDFDDAFYAPFNDFRGFRIFVDPNTVLADGRQNPNYGRPFITDRSNNRNFSARERETFRTTAFYKLDFAERGEGLARWLGSHTFTGLYNRQKIDGETLQRSLGWTPVDGNRLDENVATNSVDDPRRTVHNVFYVGPSLVGQSLGEVRIDIPEADFDPWNPGAVESHSVWDIQTLQWLVVRNEATPFISGASVDEQTIDSKAFILNSRLFSDNVIYLFGWREDESATRTNTIGRISQNVLPADFQVGDPTDEKGQTRTHSLVAKLPEAWVELPFSAQFSVFYNESENFQPTGSRVSPLGKALAPPSGSTEDYGFNLSAFRGNLNLRVNWFESAVANQNSPATAILNPIIIQHERFTRNQLAVRDAEEGIPDWDLSDWPLLPDSLLELYNFEIDTLPNGAEFLEASLPSNAQAVSDTISEGVEIELMANLGDNWRFAFNASRQEASRNNSGLAVAELIEMRLPVWERAFALDRDQGQTVEEFVKTKILAPFQSITLQDGGPVQELAEWRWSLVGNYEFTEGRLQGLDLGGGLRWQDEVAIGFPLIDPDADPNDPVLPGDIVPDVRAPFFADSDLRGDLWIGYRTEILDGVKWDIRLTARNVIGDDDPLPIQAHPDGSVAFARFAPPSKFILSSAFRF